MTRTYSLSVVIPVFNSAPSLPELIGRLSNVLPHLADEYEVILVNDDSRDASWDVVLQLAQEHAWVRGISLFRNFGQHNALLCGIRAAQHSVTVTMDDDLQHPPEEIAQLLAKLDEGYDVVYGSPEQEQHGPLRDLASQVTKFALRSTMGVRVAQSVSAFRVFRTEVRQAFSEFSGPFVSIDVLLSWGTSRFAAVTVRHEPRNTGVSNYTLYKLFTHAVNMITGFSTLPLQLASVVGFVFTLFGMLMLVYVIGRLLIEGGSVPGFPFLASSITIFSGVQLFMIGIIGEYLARIYQRIMERPSYTVRSDTVSADYCVVGKHEQEESVPIS
jgi:undecaprenyl-phosphate 4-deoxy-4-formamido-L-arabinose transferase